MAAVGALLVSSGIALMAAPTTASAATSEDEIVVCKYVGNPAHPRLQSGDNPLVVSVTTLQSVLGDGFEAWLADPTFPVSWTDEGGKGGPRSVAIGLVTEVDPVIENCPGYVPGGGGGGGDEGDGGDEGGGGGDDEGGLVTTASLDLTHPSCDNGNLASFKVTGEHAQIESATVDGVEVGATMNQSVSAGPGSVVTVELKADEEYKFDGVKQRPKFLTLTGTLGGARTDCTTVTPVTPPAVSPPQVPTTTAQVSPPKAKPKAETVTPTLVHAGLAGSAVDTSTQAALALTAAGLLLLAGAGGLVLVQGGERK